MNWLDIHGIGQGLELVDDVPDLAYIAQTNRFRV